MNLSGVLLVVEEQDFQITDVANAELEEVVGEHVAGSLSRAITNAGQSLGATEATTHAVINTLGGSVASLLLIANHIDDRIVSQIWPK